MGPRLKRRLGAYDTPEWLARRVLADAADVLGRAPVSILDPAAGEGVFLRVAWERFPEARIEGWEIDSARAEACGTPVRVGDFLAAEPEAPFDLVIGNPPWVSYSGRHAQPEPKGLPRTRGWKSLHAAFVRRAAEWVAPGGVLALVTPATVAHQRGYSSLRAELARAGRLEFEPLPEGAFEGVTMPYCLLLWSRGEGTDLPGEEPHARLMAGPIFSDPGVHTGNSAALLLSDTPRPGWLPVRVGRDVRPFRLESPRLWLNPSPTLPEGRYARVGPEDRYFKTPILVRQTASRPIAALHEPPAYFRNSVLACSGLPGHRHEYLLTLLNSRALAFLHRALNPDARQRAFPQVKVGALRRLPIVRADADGPDPEEGLRLAERWLARDP